MTKVQYMAIEADTLILYNGAYWRVSPNIVRAKRGFMKRVPLVNCVDGTTTNADYKHCIII